MPDLAEIVRGTGGEYLQSHCVTFEQRKALLDIAGCRTAAMGSVSLVCDRCGEEYRTYRSCGNRSCPQCQGEARAQWLAAREAELLPVPYLHVVFSVPAELNPIARCHPAELYEAMVSAAGQAIVDVGRVVVGAQLGCLVQLHTWGQNLAFHLHAHCVVPCGGFADDTRVWVPFAPEQLPPRLLSRRFRAVFCKRVRGAVAEGKMPLLSAESAHRLLANATRRPWSVYAKPPFGGPAKLLEYLARSMYRVAISNERIEAYAEDQVTFLWRDYRHGRAVKRCTVGAEEFLRRFLQHVPPRRFVRVRWFGFLANRNRRQNIERARELIGATQTPVAPAVNPWRLCPSCSGQRCSAPPRRHSALSQRQLRIDLRPPPAYA